MSRNCIQRGARLPTGKQPEQRAARFRLLVHMLVLAASALILASCAKTQLTRVQDPDYQNRRFARPAVFADASDLAQRKLFEDVVVAELRARGVFARPSIDVLPPTRDYGPEERVRALLAANIDAIVLISGETGVERVYVPVTGTTTDTTGSITVQGNRANYSETSQTRYQGGYTVEKPWSKITTRIVDIRTGRTAWLGDAETRGSGFSDLADIRKSYARSVAKQLQGDHVFSTGGETVSNSSPPVAAASPSGYVAPAPVAPATVAPALAGNSVVPSTSPTPEVVRAMSGASVAGGAGGAQPASTDHSLVVRLEGCVIAGDDGTFLGRVTSKTDDPKGILNSRGAYGNARNVSSIFNRAGRYGSPDSPMSAFNGSASAPPSVFCGERFEAYLTTNRQRSPAIDPRLLAALLQSEPIAPCAKDTDCDGNLVCEKGKCLVPG